MIFRVLVVALLVFFLMRFLFRMVGMLFFGMSKMRSHGFGPNSAQRSTEDSRPVGDVRVEKKGSTKSRESGDYVDYEEVD